MAELVCSPNAAAAFDFLVGKGLSDFQAAAIVGNLQQESGLNPRASGDQGASHGIAQWHLSRWDDLRAFADYQKRDPWALDLQLDFLWNELRTIPELGLDELRSSTSLEAATVAFQNLFERCDPTKCAESKRIAYAQSALLSCPQVTPPTPTPTFARRKGAVAATLGIFAILTAAGYGAYKLFSRPPLEPRRRPVPYRPQRPTRRPGPPTRRPYTVPRPPAPRPV